MCHFLNKNKNVKNMENIKIEKNGNKMVIEIDLTAERSSSKSGKMEFVASSQGWQATGFELEGKPLKLSLMLGIKH